MGRRIQEARARNHLLWIDGVVLAHVAKTSCCVSLALSLVLLLFEKGAIR